MSKTNNIVGVVKARLVELEARLDERLFAVRRGPNGELIEDEGSGISAGTALKVGAAGVAAGGAGAVSAPYLNTFRQSVAGGAPMGAAAKAGLRSAGADAMSTMRGVPGAVRSTAYEGMLRAKRGSMAAKGVMAGGGSKLGRIARAIKAAAVGVVR